MLKVAISSVIGASGGFNTIPPPRRSDFPRLETAEYNGPTDAAQ